MCVLLLEACTVEHKSQSNRGTQLKKEASTEIVCENALVLLQRATRVGDIIATHIGLKMAWW